MSIYRTPGRWGLGGPRPSVAPSLRDNNGVPVSLAMYPRASVAEVAVGVGLRSKSHARRRLHQAPGDGAQRSGPRSPHCRTADGGGAMMLLTRRARARRAQALLDTLARYDRTARAQWAAAVARLDITAVAAWSVLAVRIAHAVQRLRAWVEVGR